MFIKIIVIILLTLIKPSNAEKEKLYCWDTPKINIEEKSIVKENKKILKNNLENNLLATITIKKINLKNKPIYKIGSKENNINKNITILKDDDTKVIIAHGGLGPIAYFKNLYKLSIGDEILINRNNETYKYKVDKVYEEEKDGTLEIENEKDKLILTTCSYHKGKQLIIESKKVI